LRLMQQPKSASQSTNFNVCNNLFFGIHKIHRKNRLLYSPNSLRRPLTAKMSLTLGKIESYCLRDT
jgi:hypothetical protein